MPDDNATDFSLKRLRDLCINILEENMAILLRAALPDFPVSVVDEFFTGPKLNKPSGPDEREWTDIVRLTLIAFAPDGSEPARLRGKPIERLNRDPQPPSQDEMGSMVLHPGTFVSPLRVRGIFQS
jgi:hypothetical protein